MYCTLIKCIVNDELLNLSSIIKPDDFIVLYYKSTCMNGNINII